MLKEALITFAGFITDRGKPVIQEGIKPFIVNNEGQPEYLKEQTKNPYRKVGIKLLFSLESLADFVGEHTSPDSQKTCFVDTKKHRVGVVFNFNCRDKDEPGFGDDKALLELDINSDYSDWQRNFDEWLDQKEMVTFVEEHLNTIKKDGKPEEPYGLNLFEAVKSVSGGVDESFESTVDDTSDDKTSHHKRKSHVNTDMPRYIGVHIKKYEDGDEVTSRVKLITAVREGKPLYQFRQMRKADVERMYRQNIVTVVGNQMSEISTYEGAIPDSNSVQ